VKKIGLKNQCGEISGFNKAGRNYRDSGIPFLYCLSSLF